MAKTLSRYAGRRRKNAVILGMSLGATGVGLFFLGAILYSLLVQGTQAIRPSLFTEMTPAPGSDGGLANALYGSFIMTLLGTVVGTPIGVLVGTYVAEYSRGNKLGQAIQFINDVLLSAPSIIVGLFIYQLMVVPMGHFSGWAGSATLAILVVPVVTRTTVDMLLLVPNALREAAAALGTPKWRITVSVCYRAARQGMLTGIMLAVARISGETAPLLFTVLSNQFWSTDMNHSIANLPVIISNYALSPYADWQRLAWGAALLITVAILILNITARSLASVGGAKQ